MSGIDITSYPPMKDGVIGRSETSWSGTNALRPEGNCAVLGSITSRPSLKTSGENVQVFHLPPPSSGRDAVNSSVKSEPKSFIPNCLFCARQNTRCVARRCVSAARWRRAENEDQERGPRTRTKNEDPLSSAFCLSLMASTHGLGAWFRRKQATPQR